MRSWTSSPTTISSPRRGSSSAGDAAARWASLARTLGRRAFWSAACRPTWPRACWAKWPPCSGPKASSRRRWPRSCTSRKWTTWIARPPSFAANGAAEGDFLLAIGGGAAIDLAKAAAAMATNGESPTVKDYLENVGRGLKIVRPPLPVLAMPTTAGTGAEATKNAVISSYDPPFKKSLRDDRLMPRIALVDPELTVTRSAGGHGGQRHGRDHAVDRELRVAEVAADSPGPGRARAEDGRAGDCRGGGERPTRGRPARPCRTRRCCPAWRWPTRAWGWPTAWRRPWASHCRVPHGVACA